MRLKIAKWGIKSLLKAKSLVKCNKHHDRKKKKRKKKDVYFKYSVLSLLSAKFTVGSFS